MLNDFIPSNPGFERRLTNRVWLDDYTTEQLSDIYLTALANALSDPPPARKLTRTTTQTYFTSHALNFLSDIIEGARAQTDAGAASPLLERVFAAQAGAMTTLANVTAMLIASSKRAGRIGLSDAGLDTWALGYVDVFDILSTLVLQQLGPASAEAVREVEVIAVANGWLVGGTWQVPGSSQATPVGRRRVRR